MEQFVLIPTEEQLRKAYAVVKGNQMPAIPEILVKINEELARPAPTIARVAELIAKDQAVTGQVLKVVNSAGMGVGSKVESIAQAVSLLGLDQIRNLVIASAFLNGIQVTSELGKEIWADSLEVAIASTHIAHMVQGVSPDEAYIVGLMHDCGALLLAERWPGYERLCHIKTSHPISMVRLEESRLGTHHALVGFLFARHWKLPENIALAIRHHHTMTLDRIPDGHLRTLVAVLIMANVLVETKYMGAEQDSLERIQYMAQAKAELMLDESSLRDLREEALQGFS